MDTKSKAYVDETEIDRKKLTVDDLAALESIKGMTPEIQHELIDFIYNISLVLYKSFGNES